MYNHDRSFCFRKTHEVIAVDYANLRNSSNDSLNLYQFICVPDTSYY